MIYAPDISIIFFILIQVQANSSVRKVRVYRQLGYLFSTSDKQEAIDRPIILPPSGSAHVRGRIQTNCKVQYTRIRIKHLLRQ